MKDYHLVRNARPITGPRLAFAMSSSLALGWLFVHGTGLLLLLAWLLVVPLGLLWLGIVHDGRNAGATVVEVRVDGDEVAWKSGATMRVVRRTDVVRVVLGPNVYPDQLPTDIEFISNDGSRTTLFATEVGEFDVRAIAIAVANRWPTLAIEDRPGWLGRGPQKLVRRGSSSDL